MAKPPTELNKADLAKIYDGVSKAVPDGYMFVSLHLAPAAHSGAAAEPDPDEAYHAVLQNGHVVIVGRGR